MCDCNTLLSIRHRQEFYSFHQEVLDGRLVVREDGVFRIHFVNLFVRSCIM